MKRLLATFKRQDEKRLYDDYQYYTDLEKVRANAQTQAKELEELFARDVEELNLPKRTPAISLALSGEMVDDQPVELGRMGERAHMARALEHRDLRIGKVAPSISTTARVGARVLPPAISSVGAVTLA